MKRVIACVDFSQETDAILRCALALATPVQAEIVVLYVAPPEPDFVGYDPGPESVRDAVAAHLTEEHRRLNELVVAIKETPVRALMVMGVTAEAIVRHAMQLDSDFIVLGSHGHGTLHHLLVGSVTKEVLAKTTIPVVVVPPSSRVSTP
jgi:nucleotide-binding universal stress UspA family protein